MDTLDISSHVVIFSQEEQSTNYFLENIFLQQEKIYMDAWISFAPSHPLSNFFLPFSKKSQENISVRNTILGAMLMMIVWK